MSVDAASSTRAQSSLLGVTVLLGIVLVVSIALVVGGTSVVQESRDTTTVERASMSMEQFKSTMTELHSAPGTSRRVEFGGLSNGQGEVRVEDEGSMRVVVNDTTTSGEMLNESRTLGRVVYQHDDQIIAYQGGGIWRSSVGGSDSVAVSDPNFEYSFRGENPTLSIPMVQVSGEVSGDELRLVQPEEADVLYPSRNGRNPLDTWDAVEISVTSEFYRAWGEFFDRKTSGAVVYDHDDRTATIKLVGPEPSLPRAVPGAVTSTGATRMDVANDVVLDGYQGSPAAYHHEAPVYVDGVYTASNNVEVDGDVVATGRVELEGDDSGGTYHVVDGRVISGGSPTDSDPSTSVNMVRVTGDFSTADDLSAEGSTSGDVVYEGDVYVGGDLTKFSDVEVDGNLYVQGTISAGGSGAEIHGDVVAGNGISGGFGSDATVHGSTTANGSPPAPETPEMPDPEPIDDLLDEKTRAIANDNDNDQIENFEDISDHEYCRPECRLTAGEYHFQDSLYLYDEKLVLDTRQGPIDIYAEDGTFDGVTLQEGTNVTVLGENPVNIYTDGDVMLYNTGTEFVTRPMAKQASNVRVFVDPTKQFRMSSGVPTFTGLIFGHGESNNATVRFTNDAVVHGAVVAKMEQIDVRVQVHFDREVLSGGVTDGAGRVEYVHVSSRSVDVSG